jgi:rubrerythrin
MNSPDKYSGLQPYRIALDMEKEGKQLFLEAARTTKSNLARQTFEFLAKEEDRHLEQIEKFYRAMEESDGKDVPHVDDSDADAKLEGFNQRLESMREDFVSTASDIKAYQVALRFENGAEEFYQEMLDRSEDPRVKRFYRWLIDEENMHSRLINSCLKFVEDPTEWFRKRKA